MGYWLLSPGPKTESEEEQTPSTSTWRTWWEMLRPQGPKAHRLPSHDDTNNGRIGRPPPARRKSTSK